MSLNFDTYSSNYDEQLRQTRIAEWTARHKSLTEPSKIKQYYAEHATELLYLLEKPVGLACPSAVVIVKNLGAILVLTKEYGENDERVAAVLFAAIEMMCAFLHINKFESALGHGNSKKRLNDRVNAMDVDVKACGNALDRYLRETHIARFFSAKGWMEKLRSFIDKFILHGDQLLSILSLGTVAGIDIILKNLLHRMVNEPYEWKWHKLQTKPSSMHLHGPPIDVYTSLGDVELAELATATEDPRLSDFNFTTVNGKARQARIMIWDIRKDIATPLEDLLKQNERRFEKKLFLQLKQTELYSNLSGDRIIKEFYGPSERLHDDDLRVLWKEMGRMFCVEGGIFVLALYEYFLDKFSASRQYNQAMDSSTSYVGERSKHAHLTDPDAWTLEYFLNYKEHICQAVDADNSGFIRINEANTITVHRIKFGFSLPQWCAYSAVGWWHELQIYQMRIHFLIKYISYQQMMILPQNRDYAWYVTNGFLLWELSTLARGPIGGVLALSGALKELVHEKVRKQDEALRFKFRELEYRIEADEISQLLGEGRSLESVFVQLLALQLEHCVKILYAARTNILDWREFEDTLKNFFQIRIAVIDRLRYLKVDRFARGFRNITADSFYGGIYRIFSSPDVGKFPTSQPKLTIKEIEYKLKCYHFEATYTPPKPSKNAEEILRYRTWESYKASLPNTDNIPIKIPHVWDTDEESEMHYSKMLQSRDTLPLAVVHSPVHCNFCHPYGTSIKGFFYYSCAECNDIDVCDKCQRSYKVSKFGHTCDHIMSKIYYKLNEPERKWTRGLAAYRFNQHMKEISDSEDIIFYCSICYSAIRPGKTLYKCLENSCSEFYLCNACADSGDKSPTELPEIPPSDGEHYWWHTLMYLPEGRTKPAEQDNIPHKILPPSHNPEFVASDHVAEIKGDILALNNRFNRLESMVEDNSKANAESLKAIMESLKSLTESLESSKEEI